MKRKSTLIYLVNKIKSEVTNSGLQSGSEENRNFADNDIKFEPRETAVQSILNFARSLEVRESKSTGFVEWILN